MLTIYLESITCQTKESGTTSISTLISEFNGSTILLATLSSIQHKRRRLLLNPLSRETRWEMKKMRFGMNFRNTKLREWKGSCSAGGRQTETARKRSTMDTIVNTTSGKSTNRRSTVSWRKELNKKYTRPRRSITKMLKWWPKKNKKCQMRRVLQEWIRKVKAKEMEMEWRNELSISSIYFQ